MTPCIRLFAAAMLACLLLRHTIFTCNALMQLPAGSTVPAGSSLAQPISVLKALGLLCVQSGLQGFVIAPTALCAIPY